MNTALLKKITDPVNSLPPLPTTTGRLIQAIQDPDASASEITRIVGEDPALSMKVLRIANSPFFGFPRQITEVQRAVVLLGLNTVKGLVLSLSLTKIFPAERTHPFFEMEGFWKHSMGCAHAARILATRKGFESPDAAFTAGLLHDVGKLVLLTRCPEDFLQAVQVAHDQQVSLREAEEARLGITHDQVGAMLAERWGLPEILAEAMACHHCSPGRPGRDDLPGIVGLGDRLVHDLTIGSSGSFGPSRPLASYERIGLEEGEIESCREALGKSMETLQDVAILTP